MSQIPDMSFSNDWETIREIIRNGNRFLITTHVNADPDGLGSELALAEGLRSLNKESVILNPTTLSRHFAFLDPKHEVQVYSIENGDLAEAGFDGIFIIDISRWERLGLLSDPIRFCDKPKICIDHHPYTGGYADHHLVNVNACASAEIVYDLLQYIGVPLSKRMAECIYTSILADTGAFTFSNTNARTHHIVGELLKHGVCPRTCYENLYQNQTPKRLKFLGTVLDRMQFDCDQRLAWMTVSQQMLKENGMTPDDIEGFVDLPRNCRTVLLSMLFAEVETDDIKISLRSKGDFHSNSIALLFGGGGHTHASGIRLAGNLQSVERTVLDEARKAIEGFLKGQVALGA